MADYSTSTQHLHWEKRSLAALETRDEGQRERLPLPEPRILVNHFLQQQVSKLGRRMQVRQIVLSTAQVFLFRFYSKVDIRKTNPYLILTTAFYLACKIEECHKYIRVIATEARNLWPDCIQADVAKLGECEFWLISELNAQLIVHHPYRELSNLRDLLALSTDELALAWSVVNDQYITALPLQRDPRTIAAAAVVLVVVARPSNQSGNALESSGRGQGAKSEQVMKWIGASDLDVEAVAECVQELLSMYTALERYSEKTCKEQVNRLAKTKGIH